MKLFGRVKSLVEWDSTIYTKPRSHNQTIETQRPTETYFNEAGFITHYISINWDNAIGNLYDTFFYANNGRITKVDRYLLFIDSTKDYEQSYFYNYDSTGKNIYITSSENSWVTTESYDDSYNIKKRLFYDSVNSKKKYATDFVGDAKSKKARERNILYVYDSQKNWIKAKYRTGNKQYIMCRKIVYY
jgi:hypothetical protein